MKVLDAIFNQIKKRNRKARKSFCKKVLRNFYYEFLVDSDGDKYLQLTSKHKLYTVCFIDWEHLYDYGIEKLLMQNNDRPLNVFDMVLAKKH